MMRNVKFVDQLPSSPGPVHAKKTVRFERVNKSKGVSRIFRKVGGSLSTDIQHVRIHQSAAIHYVPGYGLCV